MLIFVITSAVFYSWSVFLSSICRFLIYIAFILQRKMIFFFVFQGYAHLFIAVLSVHLPFVFFPFFPFHLCLIFHHDVVNSFFQLVLRFVLSIAM